MNNPAEDCDRYWQTDLAAGEVRLWDQTHTLRWKVHQAEERFTRMTELIPLTQASGTRTYFDLRPYILVPSITLTVGLSPIPRADGAIGEVTGSGGEGLRHEELGQAQAWYYPADRTLLIWECYLHARFHQADPRADALLATLWREVEGLLVARLPDVERLVTTWEDSYARPAWQAFLAGRGYRPAAPAVFAKAAR